MSHSNKEILIIEEQSIVSLDLQKKLENSGYAVQRTNSIFRTPSHLKPDLVILDSVPAVVSQIQLIKKIGKGKTLPVICTSTECMDNLMKVRKLKIIASCLKPFDPQTILNTVNDYFKFPQQA